MRGAGFQSAGATPAGFGAPTQTGLGPDVVLPDTQVGGSHGSRNINPELRDYVMLDGRIVGMNNVQQLVQLAITKAEPQLLELDRLDAGFDKEVLSILSNAMAPIVARGLVEVLGVSVRKNGADGLNQGQAVTVLRWRDRTTGEEQSESI